MSNGPRRWIEQTFHVVERSRSPLAVTGLILLALYAVLRNLLERVEFSRLTPASSTLILHTILQNVFVIALVTIVLSLVAYTLPKVIPRDWLVQPPRLGYGVAIFRMFDPRQDPLARILQSVELYPGFPYFSRESDHPSAWPPRVHADRNKLWDVYSSFFQDPKVQTQLGAAPGFKATAVEILRSGPTDRSGELKLAGYISSARSYLLQLAEKGEAALVAVLQQANAKRFIETERQRQDMHEYFPNRLAVVMVRNSGRRDILNLGIELEVAGIVYDCVVDADPDKVRKSGWDGEAQRVSFERLPRGYTAQIRVWYLYQSVSEKAFPDKINFIQEITQGIRIANIAATQTQVSYDPEILADLKGYERLYLGDARKKDSYEKELKVIFEERAKEFTEQMEQYGKQHPTIKDIAVEKLGQVGVDDSQITSIWLAFRSPANKKYNASHIFSHPSGPYVLLASRDHLDASDLKLVAAKIAALYRGEAESNVYPRVGKDICLSIKVPQGFTQAAIADVAAELARDGYAELAVPALHYDVKQNGSSG